MVGSSSMKEEDEIAKALRAIFVLKKRAVMRLFFCAVPSEENRTKNRTKKYEIEFIIRIKSADKEIGEDFVEME